MGVPGNDGNVADAGIGRLGNEVGSAIGRVRDRRLDLDAVDADRDERVSMVSSSRSPGVRIPPPRCANGAALLGGVVARGCGGGGIDSVDSDSDELVDGRELSSDDDSSSDDEEMLARAAGGTGFDLGSAIVFIDFI